MNRTVIAAVGDMMFASKIRATAEHLDVKVRFVRNVAAALAAARESAPDLFIVDLQSEKLDPFELAKEVRATDELQSVPLLGFFSHVMTEIRDRAIESGYTQVVPRSVFSSKLGEILGGVNSK